MVVGYDDFANDAVPDGHCHKAMLRESFLKEAGNKSVS